MVAFMTSLQSQFYVWSWALLPLIVSRLLVPVDCWFVTFWNVGYRITCERIICVLLHKPHWETLRMFEEAYSKVAVKKTQVYEWHVCFPDGRTSVSGDPRCGPPTTSTSDENVKCVRSDRRKSIQEISAEVTISVLSIHIILHKDSNMHFLC
jgi:hypothetical protein